MPEDLDLDDNPLEGDDKDKPSRTFSQDELDRIVSREKDQAKRSVAKQLQEQLGVSIEEARTVLDEARKRSDAEKTEAQREREAAAKAKADADAERAEAARDRHALRLERNLLKAGVPDAALSRVAAAQRRKPMDDVPAYLAFTALVWTVTDFIIAIAQRYFVTEVPGYVKQGAAWVTGVGVTLLASATNFAKEIATFSGQSSLRPPYGMWSLSVSP